MESRTTRDVTVEKHREKAVLPRFAGTTVVSSQHFSTSIQKSFYIIFCMTVPYSPLAARESTRDRSPKTHQLKFFHTFCILPSKLQRPDFLAMLVSKSVHGPLNPLLQNVREVHMCRKKHMTSGCLAVSRPPNPRPVRRLELT